MSACCVQIWDDANKIQNIDVSSLEQHGKVYEDGTYMHRQFSPKILTYKSNLCISRPLTLGNTVSLAYKPRLLRENLW